MLLSDGLVPLFWGPSRVPKTRRTYFSRRFGGHLTLQLSRPLYSSLPGARIQAVARTRNLVASSTPLGIPQALLSLS